MSADDPPPAPQDAEPPRLRGLWDVMAAREESDEAAALPDEGETRPHSLWQVMGATADAEPDTAATPAEWPPVDAPADIEIPPARPQPAVRSTGREGWAIAAGMLAVPASGLAYWPGLAASLPGAAIGFLAIWFAVETVLSTTAPPAARKRAVCGGALGCLALLLGPFVFTPWGNATRDRVTVQGTRKHLQQIGVGLQRHQQAVGTYPPGGTELIDKDGRRRGGHGWMTFLLPHIGQAALFARVDLARPYDDPANRLALATPIEEFYAAGGDRRPVGDGYAVAHFAGVGGRVTTPDGQTFAAGIFGLDSAVRPEDLTDGRSQTWIVGELPGGYPPWGDPENWRTVTRGLNRDARGFGNAAGTGAMALFADGSVRFLSNQTDRELLQRLSTRDAGDLTAGWPR